ncbi:MAG: hypothetical protein V1799_18720 [bacterium]
MNADYTYSLLKASLNGCATLREVNALIGIAHRMAIIRLRQLINSGRVHLQSLPVRLESVALDCIAEVFERDEESRFIELEDFFSEDRDLNSLSPDDALFHFRTFVFRKLSDGIFRMYRENDPILSKILRNLKLAVGKMRGLQIIERFGELFIVFDVSNERREQQAEYPIVELERDFARVVGKALSAGEYLRIFSRLFSQNKECRNFFALTDLAIVVKRTIVRRQAELGEATISGDSSTSVDLTNLFEESFAVLIKDLRVRYVLSGKLDETTFEAYGSALKDLLEDTFILSNGSECEYYDYLQRHSQELTRADYLRLHRTKFEYMAKLAKKAVRDRLVELL